MRHGRGVFAVSLIALLAGCGGGSSAPAPPPPATTSVAKAIGPAGGSLSTSVSGKIALAVVPPGALPAAATVTLTAYSAVDFPRAVQALGRTPRSLPAGTAPLLEVAVDTGGVPLRKPLQLSIGPVTPPAGSIVRLAGYGTAGFTDVDTVTVAGGAATEDEAPAYPAASLAAATLYAFYLVPAAAAAPAPVPAVAVTQTAPSGAIAVGSTAQFAASESSNGFPYLTAAFAFSVDTPQVGTIDAKTGLLTTGAIDATGSVIATDGTTKSSGKTALRIASPRPARAGDAFAFRGTLSQTLTDYLLPGTTGPVSSTETAAVSQTIASSGSADGVNYTLTADEIDVSALRTYQTHTVSTLAYQTGAGGTVVRLVSQDTHDSNGAEFATSYGPNNGALTVLPETTTMLTNDAAATSLENDPGSPSYDPATQTFGPTTTRVTAPGGGYVQTTALSQVPVTYTQHDDGTGIADLSQTSGVEYDFGVPSNGSLPITVYNVAANGVKTQNGGVRSVFAWYGTAAPVLSRDTVTIAPAAALDPSCTANGVTAATLVTEQLSTVDVVLGQSETRTTKSYDLTGSGTVCVVLNDLIQTYYDYSRQEGPFVQKRPSSSTPYESTAVSESLSLTAATVASSARKAASAGTARVPVIAAARARFDAIALKARHDQERRLRSALLSRRTNGGAR